MFQLISADVSQELLFGFVAGELHDGLGLYAFKVHIGCACTPCCVRTD